jgi:hypothetical protein
MKRDHRLVSTQIILFRFTDSTTGIRVDTGFFIRPKIEMNSIQKNLDLIEYID